ncbi:kinase-like domain-containing protein [Mortierella sp. GBAus27b]|nr:hypothetical protein BGX31_003142 [Mortierella sp. GBA43]KAI8349287.1 kinase-like domain-containing protein [Mortierella sp. GBAus27b]
MSADDTTIIPPTADEQTLLTELYPEMQGPRKGVYLTFDQAQKLLHFHLPGKQLKELSVFNRGYNNRVYLARCTDASEYVIRLGGRFWDHKKITNEVQALALARKALGSIVQVPTIIGTSLDQAKASANGGHPQIISHDYILMARLPGVPLDSVWDDMSLEQRKKVVDQVAEIFARLRTIEFSAIGNFVQGPNGEASVGAMMEGGEGRGPYPSWGAFVASNIRQEIDNSAKAGDRFPETKLQLPRIETLITLVESGDLERRFEGMDTHPDDGAVTTERPISFLHGDFESRNMLVIGDKLVGLLDLEFSGAFPSEQEWCAGFEWLFARAEDPFDEGEQEKLRNMTDDQKELYEYFVRVLKDRHGIRPYGKGHQEYKVVLYHLQTNIAPWWLQEAPREEWTEKQMQSMTTAASSLDKALAFLGC